MVTARTAGNGYQHPERPLSRRRLLRGTALAGAGLTAAAMLGCTGKEETPAVLSQQPRHGGILAREGGGSSAQDTTRTFDPHVETPRLGITMRLIYQALLGYNLRTYEVEPDLADSWEQPSPTEYIFKLAPRVKWHNKPPADGRAVTAEDVVFSLNRARTNEPRFVHRSIISMVDQITAVDKTTVKITTKTPDASTLAALGSDGLVIMNPEVVEQARRFTTTAEAVGSGAFIMKEVTERVAGEYVRNPDYFKPGLPYLEGIRTPYFEDAETSYAAFLAGRLDIIGAIPGIQVKEYIARQGPGFTPQWFETDQFYLMTPQTEKKPFDDRRVTRALRLLADHQEFITAYAEPIMGGGRYGSLFAAALGAWDLPQEEYRKLIFWQLPKEPAIREALSLLNAAGFTRENPLRFEIATFETALIRPSGELLHAQFRQHSQGVVQPSDLKLYDTAAASRAEREGTFEYAIWPTAGSIPEPGVWLNQIWRTGGTRNYSKFSDPRVDALIERQNITFNSQERKAIVHEIIRSMMENSPAAPIALFLSLNAVNPKVQGFAPEKFLNGRQYQWIWLAA